MAPNAPTLREFCAENLIHVPAALAAGARRIELCDNLAVGGTTPSAGVIEAAVRIAHAAGARVMCMVRPRGGDFVHTPEELDMMERDATTALSLGVDGIVFGCLLPRDPEAHARARAAAIAAHALPGEGTAEAAYDGGFELDIPSTERLCALAREEAARRGEPVDVTFHMAFDALDSEDQLPAIDALAPLGVTRVLTHGGPAGTPIAANLDRLRELMDHAAGKLIILPGAGITWKNAGEVAEALGARELHGTKIVDLARPL